MKIDMNCPKCGAEMTKVEMSNLSIDYCPNCRGMFIDYALLKNPEIRNLEISPDQKRPDAKVLDNLKSNCPHCHAPMSKKKSKYKRGPLLDICPSCKGVWFDEGELYQLRQPNPFHKPKMAKLRLLCPACNIRLDYDKALSHTGTLPKCPRCSEPLSFETVGEVLIPKMPRRDIVATLMFIIGMLIMFFSCRAFTQSTKISILFTGSVGAVTLLTIIRALVYNKISMISGRPGIVREFDLEN